MARAPSSAIPIGLVFVLGVIAPPRASAQESITLCGVTVGLEDRELNLRSDDGNTCTTRDVARLGKLRALTKLALVGEGITDASLVALRDHPTIEDLTLHQTSITNSGLKQISTLVKLKHLDLRENTALTGSSLAALVTLPNLTSLGISAGQATDIGAAHLSRCPALRVVETESSEEVLDGGYDEPGCGSLEGCFNFFGGSVSERGLAQLAKLPVQHLLLPPERITDGTLSVLRKMPGLVTLNCVGSVDETRGDVGRCIDLQGARHVTIGGVRTLARAELRTLDIEPSLIDGATLAQITKIPGLRTLNCKTCESDVCGGACGLTTFADRCVDISSSRVRAGELKVLARLGGIERLILGADIELTRADVAAIVSLASLTSINSSEAGIFDLRGIGLSAGALAELAKLRNVKRLVLSKLELTPSVVSELGKLHATVGLAIDATTTGTPSTVESLFKVAGLRELALPSSAISDSVLELALSHPALRTLTVDLDECLDRCGASFACGTCEFECFQAAHDQCSEFCAGDASTLLLDLGGAPVASRLRSSFASSRKTLRLFKGEVTDGDLAWMTTITRLDSINCHASDCVNVDSKLVTAAGIRHLVKVPGLVRLSVPARLMTDATLAVLGKLPSLRAVNVSQDQTWFDLSSSSAAITATGLDELRPHASHIERLSMNASAITDDSLDVLATFPSLGALNSLYAFWYETDTSINLTKARVTAPGLEKTLPRFRKGRSFLIPPQLVTDGVLRALLELPLFDSLNCYTEACSTEAGGALECPRSGCVNLLHTAVTAKGARALRSRNLKLVITDSPGLKKAISGIEVWSPDEDGDSLDGASFIGIP